MKGLKAQKKKSFQHHAYGTWGSFDTNNGRVQYLETKAKLDDTEPGFETRIMKFLRPVREALEIKHMNFNQLLQRDLDDHRVATELIPYLLKNAVNGPAFFPPIVAAVLPFQGEKQIERFPPRENINVYEDDMSYMKGYSFGDAFKFEAMVLDDGTPHEIRTGRLSWNDEKAKLVILDGQHRAMAVLAIHRTLNSWDGKGEPYKHFYEEAVNSYLQKMSEEEIARISSNIELPVTAIWFPESEEAGVTSHQQYARKLFVDVNKEARPPSKARVALLSDSDLCAILMRRILNTLRSNGGMNIPIYAVEYDHPENDQGTSSKWSAISNVTILLDCVKRAVFGPEKYIDDVTKTIGGKESKDAMSEFMRETLNLKDILPSIIDEDKRSYNLEDISQKKFPRSKVSLIEEQFAGSWGQAIISMLSNLKPYKDHGLALQELKTSWSGSDPISRLAQSAVFEGVGMFWTLKESYAYFQRKIQQLPKEAPRPNAPDIVKAWQEIVAKKGTLSAIRSKKYLNADSEETVIISDSAYDIFSTHACQLGFILALRSIAHKSEITLDKVKEFSDTVIAAANAGLSGECRAKYNRLTAFSKREKSPFNLLPKHDTPHCVYFRYFWLEILSTPEAKLVLDGKIDNEVMSELTNKARWTYFQKLIAIYKGSWKKNEPSWSDEKIIKKGTESATKELNKALKKWFAINDFPEWIKTQETSNTTLETSDIDENDEENIDLDDNHEEQSLDDLLKKDEEDS